MIITCPRCQKSFNIDDKLIPTEGRLVKCGACDHTWFFKPTENIEVKQDCLLYTSPSPRDWMVSRMPSSA